MNNEIIKELYNLKIMAQENDAILVENYRLAKYISKNWGKVIDAMLYDLKFYGLKGKIILHNGINIDVTIDIKEENKEESGNKEQEDI